MATTFGQSRTNHQHFFEETPCSVKLLPEASLTLNALSKNTTTEFTPDTSSVALAEKLTTGLVAFKLTVPGKVKCRRGGVGYRVSQSSFSNSSEKIEIRNTWGFAAFES
jgi:hypothetical protein